MNGTQAFAFHQQQPNSPGRAKLLPPFSNSQRTNPDNRLAQQIAATWKVRLRLMVAFPVILSLFMLIAGFLIANYLMPLPSMAHLQGSAELLIPALIFLMTAFAFVGSLTGAFLLTRQMKQLFAKIENLLPSRSKAAVQVVAQSEMDALALALDQALLSLRKFARDSQVLENLPEAIMNIDLSGTVQSLNKRALRWLDLESSQSIGRKLEEVLSGKDFRPALLRLVADSLQDKDITSSRTALLGDPKESNNLLWVCTTPSMSDQQHWDGLSIVIKDYSDIAAFVGQLEKLERLANLGTLTAALAHEARNPLATIKTLTALLREDITGSDGHPTYLQEILTQVDRLQVLFEDALVFSKDPLYSMEKTDLGALLSQAFQQAKHHFPLKTVDFSESHEAALPRVMADSGRLSQAFVNIMKNALEAVSDGGCIKIASACEQNPGSGDRVVRISVSDNGPGIPDDLQAKIFAPLFTTKANGTGLGLALAQYIIKAHGGTIRVLSKPNHGTTFNILLPLHPPAALRPTNGGSR